MNTRWYFPVLAILVAVMLCFISVELGLRIYHGIRGTYRLHPEAEQARRNSIWKRTSDPILVYTHRPDYWKGGIRYTEAHGILRPDDVPLPKRQGTIRIALLGDSVGAGIDLAYEDRFPTLLEGMLETSLGTRAEVLNFAVNGYKTIQEALLLEQAVRPFDPDMVLVAYCMNDVANSLTPTVWFLDPSPPTLYLWEEISSRLGFGSSCGERYVPTFGPPYGPDKYWHDLYDPRSSAWRSVEEAFDRIAWYGETRGAPIAVVLFPFFLPEDWYRGGVGALHAQVTRAAERRGFHVLDLLPVFADYDVELVRDDPEDIYHPNALGHKIAAEAIHRDVLRIIREILP